MIRLFNVYYPVRTLVLLAVETLIVWTSFLLGTIVAVPGQTVYVVLNYRRWVSQNSSCHRTGADLFALVRLVRLLAL